MAGARRRSLAMEESASVVEELRKRWELASVLNFLKVFEPLIGRVVKVSAEELEAALVEPNNTLAQLHIALLKGIIPMNKTLKDSDGWMVSLSKTLVTWWPWVAEGEFPLSGTKGEEISLYKELDPIARLFILKALCEVRADQGDAASYINDAIKNGAEVSTFRKDTLASDGKGVTFWYDGNETIGYRLYKEVHLFDNKHIRRKGTLPAFNCQWETLATNLEEFSKIVNEFSSSEVKLEVAVSKSVEADVIPVLKRHLKKKEMAQRRKQREQMLLNNFRNSAITRSCRNQRPVDYVFDDYDRAITEAIQYTNKRKTTEQRQEMKQRKLTLNESSSSENNSRDGEVTNTARNSHQEINDTDDSSHEEYESEEEDNGNEDIENQQQNVRNNLRFSKRLAGIPSHTVPESMDLGAKRGLRQRPTLNSAVESTVVPDSEDEKSSGDTS